MTLIHCDAASDDAYAKAAGYRLNNATYRTPADHGAAVAEEAYRLIREKYRRGQEEHGGELWRKQRIIDMAIEEAVDMLIYLLTLRDQIGQAGVSLGDLSE